MIKRMRRHWRTLHRLMAPMRTHPGACALVGFVAGAMAAASVTHAFVTLVLGLLAGLCLALVTLVAVWHFEDSRGARELVQKDRRSSRSGDPKTAS